MKIMIMGSGGVGAYYGGLLAKQGNEVNFIARGAHLKAMQENGLRIKSIHGDFHLFPIKATDNPADTGPVDLILFCVKAHDTDEAVKSIRPAVGPKSVVLSLQNGVDAIQRIGNVIGMEHVLGGMTQISSAIESPGVVNQVSQFRRIVFGELDGSISERVQSIETTLKEIGISVEITTDILKVLWTKLVFISSASAFGSLTRLPMGEYRSVPETRVLIVNLMREVEAVARAQEIALDADVVEKSLAFMDAAAPQIKASMQLDVDSGRRTELESIIGVIGLMGRKAGIATPIADMVYASLLPIELKSRMV